MRNVDGHHTIHNSHNSKSITQFEKAQKADGGTGKIPSGHGCREDLESKRSDSVVPFSMNLAKP